MFACHSNAQIKVVNTASLRDAFCNEIVKLSPPELFNIDFRGSSNLRNFVLSPMTACPKLTDVSLDESSTLDYVMIQSQSVKTVHLSKCANLTKVRLLDCPCHSGLSMPQQIVHATADCRAGHPQQHCSMYTKHAQHAMFQT